MAAHKGTSTQTVIGPLDRVELDVGGVTFHSTVATLAAKSCYFASQLSGKYKDTACDGVTRVFLDHDPDSFRTLLAYMREGMIDAAAVDRGVLLLAEYLQMEELLVATKARAYQNLTGSMMKESAAAEMFDETYGGIRSALTRGILPESMKEDPSKGKKKKKFAILIIESECDYEEPFNADTLIEKVRILQVNNEDETEDIVYEDLRIVGALNWLYSNGYTEQIDSMHDMIRRTLSITFSGFVENENKNEPGVFTPEIRFDYFKYAKEFAMVGFPSGSHSALTNFIVARDPDGNNPSITRKILLNRRAGVVIHGDPVAAWLAKNGYIVCETELGSLLQEWMIGYGNGFNDPRFNDEVDRMGNEKSRYPYKIYSRSRKISVTESDTKSQQNEEMDEA
ncbi:hypothetical protein ACHAWC_004486 [Mediolabrus comicus]